MISIDNILKTDRFNLEKSEVCIWKLRSLRRYSQGYQLTEDEDRCCYCDKCNGQCCVPLKKYLEDHYFRLKKS